MASSLEMIIIAVLVLVLVGMGVSVAARRSDARQGKADIQPAGYTHDGRPIFPVIGYTSDGRPITADQAVGGRPRSDRTNSLSIVALVLGLLLPPLAIPIGHAARGQIRRTGERGEGMALAGLVLGYVASIVVVAYLVVGLGMYVVNSR